MCTIVDDDEPFILIDNASIVEGDEGTTNAVFKVRLSQPGVLDATVGFTTVDGKAIAGTDYMPTNGMLTFLAGETNHTVTVSVLGDELFEGSSENFFLRFQHATNAIVLGEWAEGSPPRRKVTMLS